MAGGSTETSGGREAGSRRFRAALNTEAWSQVYHLKYTPALQPHLNRSGYSCEWMGLENGLYISIVDVDVPGTVKKVDVRSNQEEFISLSGEMWEEGD